MLKILILAVLFIICNTSFLISSYSVVSLFKENNKLKKGVSILIIYFFLILVSELFLGYIINKLNIYTITLTSLIIFAISVFVCYKKQINVFLNLRYILKRSKNIEVKLNFINVLSILFLISFILISTLSLITYEYSFDGNYYHLPHIIDYVQTESIHMTNNTLWNNVYPQNIELLNMFYMLFTRSIYLIRIPQILFSVVGMITIYLMLRKHMNFSKRTCVISSIIYFITPFIFSQITTTYLDGIVITLFILLIYYLLEIIDKNSIFDEIMYFLTLSIFMGVKGTCSIYAVIITLVYIGFKIYFLIKKEEKISKLLVKWSVFLVIVILVGCNWMLVNIIRFGNPIHPFGFLGIEGMDANVDIGIENEPLVFEDKNYIEKLIISWLGLDAGYLDVVTGFSFSSFLQFPDKRVGGMGIFFTYLLIPSFIVTLFLIISKRYKISKNQILVACIIVLCFTVTPANWWGRYAGFIILLGLIAFCIIDDYFIKFKIYERIMNIYIILLYIASFVFGIYFAVNSYSKGYYNDLLKNKNDFIEYLNTEKEKNILFLEESYYDGANYLVLLKGKNIQNTVNTYYIKEMYKNASVDNHNIGTYENFVNIIDESVDTFIIVDANIKRLNYEFMEKYYQENKEKMRKVEYGENIIVYEEI